MKFPIFPDSPATKKCLPLAALRLVGVGGSFNCNCFENSFSEINFKDPSSRPVPMRLDKIPFRLENLAIESIPLRQRAKNP